MNKSNGGQQPFQHATTWRDADGTVHHQDMTVLENGLTVQAGLVHVLRERGIEVEGKSILQYTVENAMKSTKADRIIVATEDLEIKRHIDSMKYGIECIKTPQYNCGTERVRHIVKEHLPNYEKVINLQADEPMFRASSLDDFNLAGITIAFFMIYFPLSKKVNKRKMLLPTSKQWSHSA